MNYLSYARRILNPDPHPTPLNQFVPVKRRDRRVRKNANLRRILWTNENRCHYCRCLIRLFENSTLDHRVPASKGGRSVKSNLVLCCKGCNARKGDMDEAAFVKLLWGHK